MTNLCSLFLKHVSRTAFMYSYRIPPQISGFGNIKSGYGQFDPFAGVITVLKHALIISYTNWSCAYKDILAKRRNTVITPAKGSNWP